eukprot:TRINITY_DN15121_c0_g1_i1.p1 TRINITY_DN15121_c0_g1~~TRINITY_DN15121_c0_g1_i1.p1  ORF type:complete len:100 (+),score=10.96 TRINITY_DN15121_c0_g1_i1:56-355(+)
MSNSKDKILWVTADQTKSTETVACPPCVAPIKDSICGDSFMKLTACFNNNEDVTKCGDVFDESFNCMSRYPLKYKHHALSGMRLARRLSKKHYSTSENP